MSLNMGYAANQVLLNALVTWGLAGLKMLLSHLSAKNSCLCFHFPHQTAESNAILEIILSKIFAKLVQVAVFLT